MDTSPVSLFRIDPLTGCKTFLSFVEKLANFPWADLPNDYPITELLPQTAWPYNASLLFVEINQMRLLNETHGHAYGDSIIRWLGILLTEESGAIVYRIGGADFTVLLTSETFTYHEEVLQRILTRITKQTKSLGMADPAVHIALIHYRQASHASPANVLMQMSEAMLAIKNTPQTTYKVFMAEDLKVAALAQTRWTATSEADVTYQMRWISNKNVQQTLNMGRMLDQIQQEAYTDSISGLPNMRAALLRMEQAIKNTISTGQSFSILLIDGDNLRRYNDISYVVGDEMIRNLSAVLNGSLRPGDLVARWRSGDEFIAVLPNTTCEGASVVGERFRLAVKGTSQSWRFPISISIGVATYPNHGSDIDALVDKAEAALKYAKDEGKDRVIVAN